MPEGGINAQLKEFFKTLVKETISLIPVTAMFSGLVIFFTNVVFGGHQSFLLFWRVIYLVILGLEIAINLLQFAARIVLFAYIARKIRRPFSDIEEAALVHKLSKGHPLYEWTSEWFDHELERARAIDHFAEAMAKVFSNM